MQLDVSVCSIIFFFYLDLHRLNGIPVKVTVELLSHANDLCMEYHNENFEKLFHHTEVSECKATELFRNSFTVICTMISMSQKQDQGKYVPKIRISFIYLFGHSFIHSFLYFFVYLFIYIYFLFYKFILLINYLFISFFRFN